MLEIRDLRVHIDGHEIIHIDELDLPAGTRLGLVGESGSGKTMTATAIAGLLPNEAKASGTVRFDGQDLLELNDAEFSKIRGKRIGFVFQDPARALNPMMRIGRQVSESIRLHTNLTGRAVTDKVLELLDQVQLPDPAALVRRYPHQLSGGQQQRVLIAAAIATDPDLLIADEPTTALDVTVQEEILQLLISLSEERNMSVLFVSHDLGVIRFVCDRVAVIYGGHVVETGCVEHVISDPRHRYTTALLAANPGMPKTDDFASFMGQRLQTIPGHVPAVGKFPGGCRFRNRCEHASASCAEPPMPVTLGDGHRYSCWHPDEES
ncbi:ABC transporter ATP-binding protein [Ilumatobacter sp.]|uniref:ABC transporter ATP-binding protein n=1 Tax=Ilumatobacter sp. TaxID=1967498 RepID=UPI00375258B0